MGLNKLIYQLDQVKSVFFCFCFEGKEIKENQR